MTSTIKLPQHLQEMRDDMTADRAPAVLLYVWPDGRPTDCPTMASAQAAATRIAGNTPGTMVAVYELVGFAYQPIREPEFFHAPRGEAADTAADAADVIEIVAAAIESDRS